MILVLVDGVYNHEVQLLEKQAGNASPANAKRMRVTITPKSDVWTDGGGEVREYDFANNPPLLPTNANY